MVSTSGWLGLGRTRDSSGDAATREAGVSDRDALDAMRAALSVTTPRRGRAMLAMVERLGSRVDGATRVKAHHGRRDAMRAGLVLPAWWRLRLAMRRATAARGDAGQAGPPGTAQDGPGSTQADPA